MPWLLWRADQADFGQGVHEVHGYEADRAVVGKIEPVGRAMLPMMPMVSGIFLPGASIGSAEIRLDQSRVAYPTAVGRFGRLVLELGYGTPWRG